MYYEGGWVAVGGQINTATASADRACQRIIPLELLGSAG